MEVIWFYFVILLNCGIGFLSYFASRRDFKKRQAEYKEQQAQRVYHLKKEYDL